MYHQFSIIYSISATKVNELHLNEKDLDESIIEEPSNTGCRSIDDSKNDIKGVQTKTNELHLNEKDLEK